MSRIEEAKREIEGSSVDFGTQEDLVDYLREKTKVALSELIDANKNRSDLIQAIISGINWKKSSENLSALISQLSSLENEYDDEVFRAKALSIMEPLIQEIAEKKGLFYRINNLLVYGVNEKEKLIHIHIMPNLEAEKESYSEKKKELIDGFQKLADIINEKKEIQKITAISPILVKIPNFIQSLGFSDLRAASDEEWEENYPYEYENKIPVSYSEMERNNFLKKYLKK